MSAFPVVQNQQWAFRFSWQAHTFEQSYDCLVRSGVKICLSIHVSMHPSICPAIYSSSQPTSHTFNKYVLSADGVPGPAGKSLPWASCRAGDDEQT